MKFLAAGPAHCRYYKSFVAPTGVLTLATADVNHDGKIDKTKKISKTIDDPLQELNVALSEILKKINFCKEGFILNAYLDNNKKAIGAIEKPMSSYSGNKIIGSTGKATAHANLFNRLNGLGKN